ncbi:VanZ family protein [Patescibacteria group bacterium]
MHKTWSKIISWLPAVAWAVVIFILSAQPDLSTGLEQEFILRKIGHAVVFGVLALFVYFGLIRSEIIQYRGLHKTHTFCRDLILTFSITLIYAFSDEFHQTLVAGREGTSLDVGIDLIGILVVIGVLTWLDRRRLAKEWHDWHDKGVENQVV